MTTNENEMPDNGDAHQQNVEPVIQTSPNNRLIYEKMWAVLQERPGLNESELCKKHNVKYGNWQSWKRLKKAKMVAAKPSRFVAPQPPAFVPQSAIAMTVEDLNTLINRAVQDAVRDALREGVKSGRIKLIR